MIYLPLKISIAYIFSTWVYFSFGPVSYDIDNDLDLFLYLSCYVFFGVVGYIFGVYVAMRLRLNKSEQVIKIDFWVFSLMAFLSWLVFNAVATKQGFFPENIIDLMFNVLVMDFESIGASYYKYKYLNLADEGSLLISVFLLMLGWIRFIYLPYVVWNWVTFTRAKKLISTFISILPVITGLSVGANKPIFDVSLIFLFSVLSIYIIRKYNGSFFEAAMLKSVIKRALVIFFLSVSFFGFAMSSRGVNFDYIESNSNMGNISISQSVPENFLSLTALMLGHYVVQGYYGFSLSLHEEFHTTFGFGHSPFLLRQYQRVTGDDISYLTFQNKISGEWPEGLRWHSAFAQFANDVHFNGVAFIMFCAFFMIALSWVLALRFQLRELIYLLPIHAVFVIFLPANNQIYGFLDSLSLVLLIYAVLFYRVIKVVNKRV